MSRAERVKKVPPPEPPRDPRLVALAEQAERAGWTAEWHDGQWLRICAAQGRVAVSAFAHRTYGLQCIPGVNGLDSGCALEALRAAYAALGAALDQAEDAFGQVQEQAQGEVK